MFIVHHVHAEISYFHTFAPVYSSPVIYTLKLNFKHPSKIQLKKATSSL